MGAGGQWAAREGVVDGAHGFRVVKISKYRVVSDVHIFRQCRSENSDALLYRKLWYSRYASSTGGYMKIIWREERNLCVWAAAWLSKEEHSKKAFQSRRNSYWMAPLCGVDITHVGIPIEYPTRSPAKTKLGEKGECPVCPHTILWICRHHAIHHYGRCQQ